MKNFTRWLRKSGLSDPDIYKSDPLFLMEKAWDAGRAFERNLFQTGKKRCRRTLAMTHVEREDSEGEAMIQRNLDRC